MSKRQQVPAACQQCRRRKAKVCIADVTFSSRTSHCKPDLNLPQCDARRPCGSCSKRNIECIYLTQENETSRQATKREYSEIAKTNKSLRHLFSILASGPENQAFNIVHRIRSGQQVESILRRIEHGDIHDPLPTLYERNRRQSFIVALAQTVEPLEDIVDLAASVLNPYVRLNLPPTEAWQRLRDRIVTLETLCGVLGEANPNRRFLERETDRSISVDNPFVSHYGPLFWVPASPWTRLTSSDETVSHLVSLFLSYTNPFWRFVEDDLFLRAMRNRDVRSEFCSPVLVNAILACASVMYTFPRSRG